jgi:hypothetical protein
MRLDNVPILRQAVQGSPHGEQVVELAVDVALSYLCGDDARVASLLLHFSESDAQRLSTSLKNYFHNGHFQAGTTEQTIMDSTPFIRWQLDWLPNFIKTINPLEQTPRRPDFDWLTAGCFSGTKSQN